MLFPREEIECQHILSCAQQRCIKCNKVLTEAPVDATASGYRKPDTQELRLTTHYADILNLFNDASSSVNLSPEHFRIALHMSEVISVRLFDPIIYDLYFSLDEMQ